MLWRDSRHTNIIARRAHLNQYSAETDVFIDFNKYKYTVAGNQLAVSVYRIHNDSWKLKLGAFIQHSIY